MDVKERREQIAHCIINLKKGLKKMRRQDIDDAIKLLLVYDADLKKPRKSMNELPVAKNGGDNEPGEQQVTAVIINDIEKSVAYPLTKGRDVSRVVRMIEERKLEPIGEVIVEDWMREHLAGEVPFTKMYATVVVGHSEKTLENVVVAGSDVYMFDPNDIYRTVDGVNINDTRPQTYKVRKVKGDRVYVERWWPLSLFSIKKSSVLPTIQTAVHKFKVDSWKT